MTRLAIAIGTWFGCGYFPWGPGTAGSLAAVFLAALSHSFFGWNRFALVVAICLLTGPAVWAATRTARAVGKHDPGIVVIDEVLGQWVTLLGAAAKSWKVYLAAFLLFRFFDIWKPWPVRQFEKLPEGFGIVADDLAAGVYGASILYLIGMFKQF